MVNREYARVAERGELAKKCCGLYGYDWKNEFLEIDQFRDRYYDKFKTTMEKMTLFNLDGTESTFGQVETISDLIFSEVQWNRYKKIYSFSPAFTEYLVNTEAGEIHKALLERLPFKSFYISLGGYDLHYFARATSDLQAPPKYKKDGYSPCSGMFVYIYFSKSSDTNEDYVNIAASLQDRDQGSVPLYLGVRDGSVIKDSIDIDKWPEDVREMITKGSPDIYKRIKHNQEWQRPFYTFLLNACEYLCASNAEITDVKVSKKDKPMVPTDHGKKPISIQVSNVGYRIGERFEKMYQRSCDISNSDGRLKGIKKRPHVRRAHWHHYWTGPGRTILTVKWLEPVFVMGNEEDIDTVMHEVEGEYKA